MLSDRLITSWGQGYPDWQVEVVRTINDVSWFSVVLMILYRQVTLQQSALINSEAQYRDLFAANPNPMWIYSIKTLRFVMVNDACLDKYGYSEDEFLNMSIFNIRPEAEHARLKEILKDPRQGIRQAGIWRHVKADGKEISMAVTSHPLGFNGEPCKLVMATDVTEVLDKEARLQTLNDTLLRIAWSHSHELRKPLCSILGMLPLLSSPETKEEQGNLLHMLEACAYELDDSLIRNSKVIEQLSKDNG
ncbi:PAS domain S-box protein [Mucilaginibacter pallidiroseus]|nr:PAS domain S-box protein [Mucilaginibacter pallidiroseus]